MRGREGVKMRGREDERGREGERQSISILFQDISTYFSYNE